MYVFRYRVKNKHGWGPFSDTVNIRTAVIPDQVETPLFTIVQQTSVRMIWKMPYNGGNAISSYVILFSDSTGNNFYPINAYCNGNSPSIVSQRFCDIPFITLRSAPFNLVQDQLVRAKLAATNIIGTGAFSPVNTEGVTI